MTQPSGLGKADAIMARGNNIIKWSLDSNRISDEGGKAVAEALKHENNKVQYLILWDNRIDDEGAKALAEALKHENNKLKHLDLYDNRIGDEGAKAIAVALLSVNCRVKRNLGVDGDLVSDAVENRRVLDTLLVLLSAREVRRIGTKAPMRKLPSDLIRLLADMVQFPEHVYL